MKKEIIRKYYQDNKKTIIRTVAGVVVIAGVSVPVITRANNQNKLNILNEKITNLEQINLNITDEIKELNVSIEEKDKSITKLNNDILELEEFNKSLQKENNKIKVENETLKDDNNYYKSRAKYLEEKQESQDEELKKN